MCLEKTALWYYFYNNPILFFFMSLQNCTFSIKEKPLRISGDASKVEHAKQLVYELLADKDMQGGGGGQRQYDDGYQQDQGNGLATNSTEVTLTTLTPKWSMHTVVQVEELLGRGGRRRGRGGRNVIFLKIWSRTIF